MKPSNRREFFAVAEQERLRAARYGQCISVAYMDLDGFKEVNDRLGHSAGDAILIDVANQIRKNLRAIDMVARMGGDEFVILLRHASARLLATQIDDERTAFEQDSATHTEQREPAAEHDGVARARGLQNCRVRRPCAA